VRTSRNIALIIIPLLFSCFPKKPEIPMSAAPAGPVLQALDQRRTAFPGLKAVASIEVSKRGRKRTFETVGIVLDSAGRLRLEAYGPLGQSILAFVWNGQDAFLRMPGTDEVVQQGPSGLERLIGESIDVRELCALLSGNVPTDPSLSEASLLCSEQHDCILEMVERDSIRRIFMTYRPGGPLQDMRVTSQELYRSGKLLYQARFDLQEMISRYTIPMNVTIDSPEHKLLLNIAYSDVEITNSISPEMFILRGLEP
jgi:hypothetical protein